MKGNIFKMRYLNTENNGAGILQYIDFWLPSECDCNCPFTSQEQQVQLRFEISMQGNLESCKICEKLLEEAQLKGDTLPLRAYCFAVATALKQVQYLLFWFVPEFLWFYFCKMVNERKLT